MGRGMSGRWLTILFLLTGLVPLAGCIAEPPGAVATACPGGGPGPGDLQVHVVPSARHLEHSDWDAAADKQATITPFLDNGTHRYTEDEERLPAVTGPLDDDDCIRFQDIGPGWWEIRATARADDPDCSWYGGGGKMVLVEAEKVVATRFQPTLTCA